MEENNQQSPKKLGDKIFGAHNNPVKEFEYTDSFDIDHGNIVIEDQFDEEDYLHKKKLEEAIYEAFKNSRWYPLSYKKKVPKDLIPHLFQEILEQMTGNEFSFSEKFVSICDFLSISYTKAYESIPIRYKEIIINELEEKYKVLSKRKIGRLF